MAESNFNVVAETDAGYGQMFSVLIRRRFWLIGVLCGVLSVATVLTLTAKPTYQSSMQLLIEPNYQGKKSDKGEAEPEAQFADSNIEIDYATQLNVMRSSVLIQKAVYLLEPEYPTISVDEIKKSLILTQLLEDEVYTKIVEAVYTDNDPLKTKKVLETIYKVYQLYNREQQEQRLKNGLKFINEQIPVASKLVEQSEAKLEQFRKSQNLIDPQQQAIAKSEALKANEQEQQATRTQLQESQARYTALQQQIARSPRGALISSRLSQSSRYQTLLDELQKTELALAQRRIIFTDTDPSIQKLIEQRQSQRTLLQSEAGRVLGIPAQANSQGENLLAEGQFGKTDLELTSQLLEVQTNRLALKSRATSLAQTELLLQAELNRFSGLLTEYNRLEPFVQINQNKLEQLLKAQQELSLEIARGGFDWQALEEPQLGEKTGPSVQRNLLMGVVVGLILGGCAAFLREMVDDTVVIKFQRNILKKDMEKS